MVNRTLPGRKIMLDKSLNICYNNYSERKVIKMDKVYYLVKCWYDRDVIDDQEWKEFCELMLRALMEENQDVLKRLKNS